MTPIEDVSLVPAFVLIGAIITLVMLLCLSGGR